MRKADRVIFREFFRFVMVTLTALIFAKFGGGSNEYNDCYSDLESFGLKSKEWANEDDA